MILVIRLSFGLVSTTLAPISKDYRNICMYVCMYIYIYIYIYHIVQDLWNIVFFCYSAVFCIH
jgi:hypothetical protein